MERRTQQELKLKVKKIKRNRRVFFFLGLLVGGSLVFLFFIYYQVPSMEKTYTAKETHLSQEIKAKDEKIQQFEKQATEFDNKLEVEKEKQKRMVFGNEQEEKLYPELATKIENTLLASKFIGTALVIKNNQLVLEKGFGYSNQNENKSNDINTTYMIGSVQKVMTAVLAMKLVEDGKITLQTPVSDFFPTVQNSKAITVRDLLDMTSGLTIKDTKASFKTEQEVVDDAVQRATYAPLEKWRYSAVNYTLLAGIIRQVTQEDYSTYLKETIIEKLALKHTGLYDTFSLDNQNATPYQANEVPYKKESIISKDNYEAELGTGNVYMSVGDLMTFYQALDDGKIISKANVNQLRTSGQQAFKYIYAGGMYVYPDKLTSHGVIRGFESSVILSGGSSSGVILFSNQRIKNDLIPKTAEIIFSEIQS